MVILGLPVGTNTVHSPLYSHHHWANTDCRMTQWRKALSVLIVPDTLGLMWPVKHLFLTKQKNWRCGTFKCLVAYFTAQANGVLNVQLNGEAFERTSVMFSLPVQPDGYKSEIREDESDNCSVISTSFNFFCLLCWRSKLIYCP